MIFERNIEVFGNLTGVLGIWIGLSHIYVQPPGATHLPIKTKLKKQNKNSPHLVNIFIPFLLTKLDIPVVHKNSYKTDIVALCTCNALTVASGKKTYIDLIECDSDIHKTTQDKILKPWGDILSPSNISAISKITCLMPSGYG